MQQEDSYWLATDTTIRTRQKTDQKKGKRNDSREKLRTSGLTRSSPLTRL
jgi:hypothetical protein